MRRAMPSNHSPCEMKHLLAMTPALLLAAHTLACPALGRDDAVLMVNAAREHGAACTAPSAGGAGALRWSDRLEQAALAQAQWLASRNTLLHTGPQGRTLSERARAVGYRFVRVTENLGYGQTQLPQVLKGWTDSPTHCANLHDPRVTEMALACVPSAAGRPLWVMLQGRPS